MPVPLCKRGAGETGSEAAGYTGEPSGSARTHLLFRVRQTALTRHWWIVRSLQTDARSTVRRPCSSCFRRRRRQPFERSRNSRIGRCDAWGPVARASASRPPALANPFRKQVTRRSARFAEQDGPAGREVCPPERFEVVPLLALVEDVGAEDEVEALAETVCVRQSTLRGSRHCAAREGQAVQPGEQQRGRLRGRRRARVRPAPPRPCRTGPCRSRGRATSPSGASSTRGVAANVATPAALSHSSAQYGR